MPDLLVTCPKRLWKGWIEEGDAAGDPPTGELWGFYTWGVRPNIVPGERVYIAAQGRLRGYAPLTECVFEPSGFGQLGRVILGRRAGAVSVTIDQWIQGFRGWRYVWWQRGDERPFPEWKTEGVDEGRRPRPAVSQRRENA